MLYKKMKKTNNKLVVPIRKNMTLNDKDTKRKFVVRIETLAQSHINHKKMVQFPSYCSYSYIKTKIKQKMN